MTARARATARTRGRLARSAAGRQSLGGAQGSTGPRQTGATAPGISQAVTPADDRDEARVGRGGPGLVAPLGLFGGPLCAVCSAPLPEGSRRDRATCSPACRKTASRRALSVTSETGGALGQGAGVSRAPGALGGPLAAIAEGIATPADEYGPARAYVAVRDGGYGVVFGLAGGLRDEPAGPAFPRPRQAIDLASLLNDRITPAAPTA